MSVITGFPFILPDIKALTVYMPWMNHQTNEIWYQGINDFYWDNGTGVNDCQAKLAKWCWLNKLNPDWKDIAPTTGTVFAGISGSGMLPAAFVEYVGIRITAGGDTVDKWWGTQDIGKYGTCTFANGVPPEVIDVMPLNWINTQDCTILAPPAEATFFRYWFQPGITADISIHFNEQGQAGEKTSVPPIYYLTPAVGDWINPFHTDAGPPEGNPTIYGP